MPAHGGVRQNCFGVAEAAPGGTDSLALLVIRRGRRTLMRPSPRVPGVSIGAHLASFRHTITHRHYEVISISVTGYEIPKFTE